MAEDYNEVREAGAVTYADLGYHTAYEAFDHRLEVKVYYIAQYSAPTLYRHCNGFDLTEKLAEAEVLISGSVKWDGCSNWTLGVEDCMTHFCGRSELVGLGELLARLWDLAAEKVPHSHCVGGAGAKD